MLRPTLPAAPPPAPNPHLVVSRRAAHLQLAGLAVGLSWAANPRPAAAGLVQFPVESLKNEYFLVRAGQSEAEAQGYALTNPVAKTSMSNALSAEGRRQVARDTLAALRAADACDDDGCWLWPGMAMSSYQTAELLGALLGLGRSRLVPEFSKLDARGVGALERGQLAEVAAAVAAGDATAPDWRPPRGSDGTPDESALDVATRGRELLSLLETQFSGATVILISPDSDNLSILQAGVAGVDLRGHARFAFKPGEARRLQTSAEPRAAPPASLPCPRPPLCT